MIAELTGTLTESNTDSIVINVAGVGYLVFCPTTTLLTLPGIGEKVSLKIETHVREDHIHLFGFVTSADRDWFKSLQNVQGVGARVAMAILSAVNPRILTSAVAAQDPLPLTQASGVGPKLAKRIIGELRDSSPKDSNLESHISLQNSGKASSIEDSNEIATQEAVSALVNLGYGRTEAYTAVSTAGRNIIGEKNVEELIRNSLLELG